MDHIVVDVEIQKCIEETPDGWDATDKLGVAVACVWEYQTQRMRIYGPDDLPALRERLLEADRVSGFNIWNFDFAVVWGISKRNWMTLGNSQPASDAQAIRMALYYKTDDMLRRIWQAKGLNPDQFDPKTHGGVRLDVVASATIGASAPCPIFDAPKWYQAGLIQKVVNYCADNVAMERDLTDFVDRYGYVLVGSKDNQGYAIHGNKKLNLPKWKGSA